MEKKEHIGYFDFLRAIAAISVIYMHTAASPLRGAVNLDWHIINVFTSFAFTAVPLFFMMSGALLLSGEKTLDTDVLLKKRLPRLLVPLIGWTVVAILWKMISAGNISLYAFAVSLTDALSDPAYIHFWYMYTLIAIYIISPVLAGGIKALDKKGHIMILVIIGLISLRAILDIFIPAPYDKLLAIDLLDKLSFFGGHLCTFILGYYLAKTKIRIPNWVLIVCFFLLLAVISIGTWQLTCQNGAYTQTFQSQSAGFEILLAACIFLFFKQNLNRSCAFFRYIPVVPLFLGIYLMHNILLSMMVYVFNIETFFDTVYLTLLNFAVCFIALKTAATIKPLCFIFVGMSYKEACRSCNWIWTLGRLTGKKQKE